MINDLHHLVICVDDLVSASNDFVKLGFTIVSGNDNWGRESNFIFLADGSYLELVSRALLTASGLAPAQLDISSEGFAEWVLYSDALKVDLANAQKRGLLYQEPQPLNTLATGSHETGWQINRNYSRDLPSICNYHQSYNSFGPLEALSTHANGFTRIGNLSVAVNDPIASKKRYEALIGIEAELKDGVFSFELGRTSIVLLGPEDIAGVKDHLKLKGEGLFRITFVGTKWVHKSDWNPPQFVNILYEIFPT